MDTHYGKLIHDFQYFKLHFSTLMLVNILKRQQIYFKNSTNTIGWERLFPTQDIIKLDTNCIKPFMQSPKYREI